MQLFGESPVAMLSKALHQRQPLVKRKLSSAAQNLNKSFSKVAKTPKLSVAVDETPSTSTDAIAAQDLMQLMLELKTKFQTAKSHSDKAQILTCEQSSWTIGKTAEFFQCKVYTA